MSRDNSQYTEFAEGVGDTSRLRKEFVIPPSEWSAKFQKRMRQSMGMSFYKYGAVRDGFPNLVDAIQSLKRRLAKYEDTGNADFLVDIANFAMIEFMLPAHDDHHDGPEQPGGGRYWHSGGRANEKGNDGERI